MTRSAAGIFGPLVAVSRGREWWEYKLIPIFAIFYATALYLDVPIASLWPAALALLAAILPGALYVSVINDLTDRAEDEAAGKPNRMAGRPAWQAGLLIAVPVAIGLGFAFLWRDDPPLLLTYLGAWAAFTLYSLPPIRLKGRGLAGVLADASGAHLLPTMVAALLVFREAGRELDPVWIAAVAVWAASYGLRGIIWHQLGDRDHDRTAGVRTFAQRHRPERVAAAVRWLVFPFEVAGLTVLLWLMGEVLPLLALILHLIQVRRRVACWDMHAVLVQTRPRYLILLADYYDVFLPLALLIASALQYPLDLAAIAVHLLLFPGRARMVAADSWRLRYTFAHLVPGRGRKR